MNKVFEETKENWSLRKVLENYNESLYTSITQGYRNKDIVRAVVSLLLPVINKLYTNYDRVHIACVDRSSAVLATSLYMENEHFNLIYGIKDIIKPVNKFRHLSTRKSRFLSPWNSLSSPHRKNIVVFVDDYYSSGLSLKSALKIIIDNKIECDFYAYYIDSDVAKINASEFSEAEKKHLRKIGILKTNKYLYEN